MNRTMLFNSIEVYQNVHKPSTMFSILSGNDPNQIPRSMHRHPTTTFNRAFVNLHKAKGHRLGVNKIMLDMKS